MNGLTNHVVDGAHDKSIHPNSHGLFHLIEQHGDESVELDCTGEGLLHLHLGNGTLNLERHHLVEELSFCDGLVENVRVIGLAVGQIPAFILHGNGHFAGNLLHDRTVLELGHDDRRGRATIGAVDENHLADVIDKALDVLIERIGVKDCCANVNDIGQVLIKDGGISDCFIGCGIHELINLSNFHFNISFHLVELIPLIHDMNQIR